MAAILERLQQAHEGEFSLSVATETIDETAPDAGAAPQRRVDEDPRVLAKLERERRHLQKVIALIALIPVLSGLYGVLFGPSLTGDRLGISGDSHYRYLAGLLFAIGLLFWSTIPNIEATGPRFRLLTLLVFIGGLARFLGMMMTGLPSLYMIGALGLELVVTPLLCLWQWRIARGYLVPAKEADRRRKAPVSKPEATAPRPAPSAVLPEDLPEPIPAREAAGEPKPV